MVLYVESSPVGTSSSDHDIMIPEKEMNTSNTRLADKASAVREEPVANST